MRTFTVASTGQDFSSAAEAVKEAIKNCKSALTSGPSTMRVGSGSICLGDIVTMPEIGFPIYENKKWVWSQSRGLAYPYYAVTWFENIDDPDKIKIHLETRCFKHDGPMRRMRSGYVTDPTVIFKCISPPSVLQSWAKEMIGNTSEKKMFEE